MKKAAQEAERIDRGEEMDGTGRICRGIKSKIV